MTMIVDESSDALINYFGVELMNRADKHLKDTGDTKKVDEALPFLRLADRLP